MASYPVSAVKRAHDVLQVLVEEGTAGATSVAAALDIPKSTAHDHLRTLERIGYVLNEGGTYRLSTRFLDLGEIARNNDELFAQGREEAFRLSRRVDETGYVQLATEEHGRCAVLLAPRLQRESLEQQSTTYPRRPHLHSNAPGKAILATVDAESVERILANHGLPRWTDDTITDREVLFEELEHIREVGFAVDDSELLPGMTGVAAPIVTDETVHGAIAVYSASGRFPTDPAESAFVELVRESADEIEANLIFAQD
ncbi:IclR family transcriptional regulator [Haloarchaeobius sp. TZWWS8]|uniref:IclR family transcriptional regulator n=1 Tax=Haloarchaeobius sp. TZWWS8 TaxID=3446121 RepID=UPI003EBDBE24